MTKTIKDLMETLEEYANGGVSGLYPPEDDIQELVDFIYDLVNTNKDLKKELKASKENEKDYEEYIKDLEKQIETYRQVLH